MHGHGAHAESLQLTHDPVGASLGPTEHKSLSVLGDKFGHHGHPIGSIDLPEVVGHVGLLILIGSRCSPAPGRADSCG